MEEKKKCLVEDWSTFDDIYCQIRDAQCSYSKLHGGFGEEIWIEEFDKSEKREIRLDYLQLRILYEAINLYYGKYYDEMHRMHQEALERKSEEFIADGGLERLSEVIRGLCRKAGEEEA